MIEEPLTPPRLDRWTSFRFLLAFSKRPLLAMRRLHDAYGPIVELQYPHSSQKRPQILGYVADAELYRTIIFPIPTLGDRRISIIGDSNTTRRAGSAWECCATAVCATLIIAGFSRRR